MIKAINKILLFVALVVFLIFSQKSLVFAQNSYELFWPIVAGRTSEDPLYSLKLLKEKIRGMFIFSDIKKAEYALFLSEKRLVEFENLIKVKNDKENAVRTLDALNGNYQKVVDRLAKAKDGSMELGGTKQRILNSFGNQVLILESLLGSLDSSLKDPVASTLSFLEAETEKLR